MNVYKGVVLPLLYGIAAVLVSVAAVVLIVGEFRNDGNEQRGDARSEALALADVLPALRGFAQSGVVPEELTRTYLGVSASDQDGAVVVQALVPGGPADKAGVQVGDTVRSVNDTAVTTVDELRTALVAITNGDEYTVAISREGAEQSLTVQRMSLEDAMRAGIGGAFERFRDRAPHSGPSATPGPQT